MQRKELMKIGSLKTVTLKVWTMRWLNSKTCKKKKFANLKSMPIPFMTSARIAQSGATAASRHL